MAEHTTTFDIGHMRCMVLQDGARLLDAASMLRRFPTAGEADYRQAYTALGLSLDAADDSRNMLLVRTGEHTVLIDAGEGGDLLARLAEAGITPEAITLVVITHTHGDHVLGLLDAEGRAAFPKAHYVITPDELAFWEARIAGDAAGQGAILDMMRAAGLRTIAMDEAIVPGITAYPLAGHTPGHIGVLLEAGDTRLLHLSDLLHSPMQFAHPEWCIRFDHDTEHAVHTRRAALAYAADTGTPTLLYHLAFPGIGRVQRSGEAFAWQPLPMPEP
jgi:glyoxylase-like metal-dependent hydrolase (beta-lactamase superfamily II)